MVVRIRPPRSSCPLRADLVWHSCPSPSLSERARLTSHRRKPNTSGRHQMASHHRVLDVARNAPFPPDFRAFTSKARQEPELLQRTSAHCLARLPSCERRSRHEACLERHKAAGGGDSLHHSRLRRSHDVGRRDDDDSHVRHSDRCLRVERRIRQRPIHDCDHRGRWRDCDGNTLVERK